jgi:hypothetical protein
VKISTYVKDVLTLLPVGLGSRCLKAPRDSQRCFWSADIRNLFVFQDTGELTVKLASGTDVALTNRRKGRVALVDDFEGSPGGALGRAYGI